MALSSFAAGLIKGAADMGTAGLQAVPAKLEEDLKEMGLLYNNAEKEFKTKMSAAQANIANIERIASDFGVEKGIVNSVYAANGGDESRQFISVELINAGSGYATGTHAFTGTEIQGAARGTGLELSVVADGSGNVTGVTVTSNPTSGQERAEITQKGYTENEILTLTGHSGSGAQIKVKPGAKMSTGGEPYTIV